MQASVAHQTEAVQDHQALQTMHQALSQRVRDLKHQLTTRADPSGNKDAVQSKLTGIQVQWVISSMVLEVGVNNQNWALTLAYYRFKYPVGLKLELTFDC